MSATLNFEIRDHMRDLYPEHRWGVLTVLVLHADVRNRCWPSIDLLAHEMSISPSKVSRAKKWLLEHKAIELVPYEQRVDSERSAGPRQHVYQLTGTVKIGETDVPYLYYPTQPTAAPSNPSNGGNFKVSNAGNTGVESTDAGNLSIYIKDSTSKEEDSLCEIDEAIPRPTNSLNIAIARSTESDPKAELPTPGKVTVVEVDLPTPPDPAPETPAIPFKQDLPALETPYQWLVSSAIGTLAHIGKRFKGRVLCGSSVLHRESLTAPIGQRPPCADCQERYEKLLHPDPVPLTPPKDAVLRAAVALHLQEFIAGKETAYTGILAQIIARYWREELKTDDLTRKQYEAIARSVPVFVKWYRLRCRGMELPTRQPALEDWYWRFPKNWRPGQPVVKEESIPDGDGFGPLSFTQPDEAA